MTSYLSFLNFFVGNQPFARLRVQVFSKRVPGRFRPDPRFSVRGTSFPDNAKLIELAREAGAVGNVPDCINSGKYLSKVTGEAAATHTNANPRRSRSTATTMTRRHRMRQDQGHRGRRAGHRHGCHSRDTG